MMLPTARSILQHLGGAEFISATGANNLVAGENSICFRVTAKKTRINCIRITLCGTDLYDVDFLSIRAFKVSTVDTCTNIQAEQLRELFEIKTGMRTSI